MNANYDEQSAKKALEEMYLKNTDGRPLGTCDIVHGGTDAGVIRTATYPPSVRMMIEDGEGEVDIIWSIKGILCGTSFPPIIRQSSPPNLRNIRQHAKITGLGAEGFNLALRQLEKVKRRFQDHIGENANMVGLNFLPYEGHPTIDSHARYFTDRRQVPFDKNEPFPPAIDPHGVLTELQPQYLIRGPDNIVEYGVREVQANGKVKHKPTTPGSFKCGDIVEISFAFIAIPIKQGRHLLMLNLRAVTLIDDGFRKKATERQRANIATGIHEVYASPNRVRRKRLIFDDSDDDDARGPKRPTTGASMICADWSNGPAELTIEDEDMEEGELTARGIKKMSLMDK